MFFRRIRRVPARWMRLTQIAQVLAKHGLSHWLHYMGLSRYLGLGRAGPEASQPGHWADDLSLAQRLALALEELGPSFVKLGQVLSTRPDIVPEPYVRELRRLQDRVQPFPGDEARHIVEQEFHAPASDLFAEFEETPIASGSIAQVHRARLRTGEAVVVKVKRPGIGPLVERDLDVFAWIASNLERFEALQVLRPRMIVEEFSRTIRREMDLLCEASYTDRFRAMYRDTPRVRVPRVFWDLSTSEALTLECIEGVTVTDTQSLAPLGVDRREMAERLVGLFLDQFFTEGLFHADPHPGNLLIGRDGAVGMVDFGMVGHLDEDLREHLGTSLLALVRRDVGMILDVYLEIGYVSDDTDLAGLRREMLGLLDRYYGIPVKHVDLQQAFGDCMRIAREHHVPLPRDFVLLGKAFVTIMGYACALDPDFDIARVVRPYALRLLRRKLSPARLGRMGLSQAWQWNNLLRRAPSGLRQFGRKLLDGDMRMKVSIEGLEPVGEELDRATNRVALSVILGSVVIGSSLTLHARIPPFVSDVPGLRFLADWVPELSVIGLVGFVVAGALGMLVAWGIWKHGKL